MKSNFFASMLVVCILSNCERENSIIQNELDSIDNTKNNTHFPDYIRQSAVIFTNILKEEEGLSRHDLSTAHWDMLEQRNATTIGTYLAFLRALEKKLPDELPPEETYQAMKSKAGKADIIEYNVAQTVIMMSNSIQNITLYNDQNADTEIEGVLKRLKEKHGASETGKRILELLKTVHQNGIQDRTGNFKPWETPRRPPEYIPSSKKP